MKRILFVIFLALLVACQPQPEPQTVADEPEVIEPQIDEPEVEIKEEVVEPETVEPTEEANLGNMSFDIVPTAEINCVDSIAPEDFAAACGLDASDVSVTFREGTKNCLVSLRHKTNRNAYSNVELTRYPSKAKAESEFNRRLKVRMAGASDDDIPGARTYEFGMAGMHNVEFIRGPDIVQVQSSLEFCPEDKLMDFAKSVSAKLK